jgi:hypothetical protein
MIWADPAALPALFQHETSFILEADMGLQACWFTVVPSNADCGHDRMQSWKYGVPRILRYLMLKVLPLNTDK